MWLWLKLLIRAGIQYAIADTLWREAKLRHELKRLAIGLLFAGGAVVFLILAIIFLLASLFFQLANFVLLVNPALFTGGLSFIIALLLLLESLRRFKQQNQP
jgi:hypothetical protein